MRTLLFIAFVLVFIRIGSGKFREEKLVLYGESSCTFLQNKELCIQANEQGFSCKWCEGNVAKSACYDSDDANNLSSAIFTCKSKLSPTTKFKKQVCQKYKSMDTCVQSVQDGELCYWCRSATVPSKCYSEAEAKLLTPGIFICEHRDEELIDSQIEDSLEEFD